MGNEERVLVRRGIRAIRVRAIEVLLIFADIEMIKAYMKAYIAAIDLVAQFEKTKQNKNKNKNIHISQGQ